MADRRVTGKESISKKSSIPWWLWLIAAICFMVFWPLGLCVMLYLVFGYRSK